LLLRTLLVASAEAADIARSLLLRALLRALAHALVSAGFVFAVVVGAHSQCRCAATHRCRLAQAVMLGGAETSGVLSTLSTSGLFGTLAAQASLLGGTVSFTPLLVAQSTLLAQARSARRLVAAHAL